MSGLKWFREAYDTTSVCGIVLRDCYRMKDQIFTLDTLKTRRK